MLTGEQFAPDVLAGLLAGKHNVCCTGYARRPFDGYRAAASARPATLLDPTQLRLVVLDATWRKSRKMML